MNEQQSLHQNEQLSIQQIEQRQVPQQFHFTDFEQISRQKLELEDSRDKSIIRDVKLGIEQYSTGQEVLRRQYEITPPQEDSKAGMMKLSRGKVESTRKEAVISASQLHVANYSADSVLYKKELEKFSRKHPNGIDPSKVDWQKELNLVGVAKN